MKFLKLRVTSSLLDPHTLLSTLFSYTHSLCFFPLITKHISVTVFRRVRIHSEKRLLTLSCSSVCLSARISTAPTGRILVNLILGAFTKICRETRNLFEIRQKYWVLYMNTSVYFTLLAVIYVVQQ